MKPLNAFVTGGSRGIGREIVLQAIAEGYGCAFTYNTNHEAAQETIQQARALRPDANIAGFQLDLTDPPAIEHCIEQTISMFENIGVVINNAAIVQDGMTVMMSNEAWEQVIAVNLSGTFYVIREFLPHLLSNRFGRIVNISSLAQTGSSGQINYAASKAGLNGITQTIMREYGAKNITCNTVVVGLVETDMSRPHMDEKLKETWLTYCPMKRFGTPQDVAGVVHFLTTKQASFITGETIHVCGGLTYVP